MLCTWVAVCITVAALSCSQTTEKALRRRAGRIHEEAIVIDAHVHPKSNEATHLHLGEKTGEIEVDFITMEEGGLDAVFFSVPLLRGSSGQSPEPAQILEDIESLKNEVGRYGTLAETATSPEEILRIHGSGKRVVLVGMETRDPFGGDLGTLKQYYEAGVRMITLTRHRITATTDSEADDNRKSGLNEFGKRVIEEMNDLGMIIDITHTPDSLQMDIIRTSVNPVIASHSCCRALNDIPREIPDTIIEALAERGGIICVTFYPGHISKGWPDQPVSVDNLVDHIDHIVKVAGIDHVGFGSDFLGSENHTAGLESAAGLPAITYQLIKRGYIGEDIKKILGGNLIRVFKMVKGDGRAVL